MSFAGLIAAESAASSAAERSPRAAPANVGFGSDLSCVSDLDPYMVEVAEDDETGVSQALARRFQTGRGRLIDEPDYGLDLRQFARKGVRRIDPVAIAGMIRAEASKDDRVASVDVVVTENSDGRLEASLNGATYAAGPFSLTMVVTDAEVILREMAG